MNDTIVWLFGEIANALRWPVAVALMALLVYAVMDVGALAVEAWQRRKQPAGDIEALAPEVDALLDSRRQHSRLPALPPAAVRVWRRIERRLTDAGEAPHLDLWLDEAVRQEELTLASRLDRGRAIVRLGPMLGLAGTIIPLGPALQSLFGGDMASMVNHLVFGFGAVVCGLLASGVEYVLTMVRERWARIDLKAVEDVAELVTRAMERRSHSVSGARHADIRSA